MKTVSVALLSFAGTAIATDATQAHMVTGHHTGPGRYTTVTSHAEHNPYNNGDFSTCQFYSWPWDHVYGYNRHWGWWFQCRADITVTTTTDHHCQSGQLATANSCETCPTGKFSSWDNDGMGPTSGCESCPIGKFETSSRASCSSCGVGEQGNGFRTDCMGCPTGTFNLVAGTGCEPYSGCGAGLGVDVTIPGFDVHHHQWTPLQDTPCVPCDAAESKFSAATSNPLGTCQDHEICGVGSGSSNALSNTQDSACQPCDPTIEFSDSSSPGPCTTKSTHCVPGKRFKRQGPRRDRTCPDCTGTTFNDDDGNDSVCHPKTQECDKGTALSVTDNTQDNQCVPCPAGHFQDQDKSPLQCQPKQTTCATGEWITYSSDATANNNCDPCDAMPGKTADGIDTAEWASTDLQTDAKCPWNCTAGFEETHGSTRCSEPGANIKLKAGKANSEGQQTQITLTAHKNGVIKLAGNALGSTSPMDVCLEANLCNGKHGAGGSAAVHTQTASHTRRLAEMDTWKDEIGARMAAIEAKLGM